eukprot:COSAG05_NODE_16211_length_351_cov_0.785714_2_plen_60_part_00
MIRVFSAYELREERKQALKLQSQLKPGNKQENHTKQSLSILQLLTQQSDYSNVPRLRLR